METNEIKQQDLVITRIISAPRERVWNAWTKPEEMKKWWGPKGFTCPDCTIDFRIGGKYIFSMQDEKGFKIWSTGVYTDIIIHEKLVFTDSFSDESGNIVSSEEYGMTGIPPEMIISVLLEDDNGKTKMRMTHSGLPAGEHHEGSNTGWNTSFDKLEESLK